jgi:polyferredoxin/tetratricopeptide (TPR) repeat protein
MKSGCESPEAKARRTIELPVLANTDTGIKGSGIRASRRARWRAAALVGVYLLMIAHIIQWQIMGSTVSPIEPSEAMYTIRQGAVNAGAIFFALAILATLVLGRFVCGWGCHIVALQDLCTWLLKKIGLNPRPFRSRLLVFVPFVAAFYMFFWPTVLWALTKPKEAPLIPGFSNHLITSDFWATFPPVWVAIPFLFICGFMVVYFLGSKGFCTYGCPYGAFFGLADRVAPGKIRVTDACNSCGHCTATCTSNVMVHAEVRQYGMVVDPGCMKCMDCVSVCPNDALYYGFGKPSIAVRKTTGRSYSLSWPEEIAAAFVFLVSFLAIWNVYQLVPMLMALGIAAITTFLAVKTWQLALTKRDLAFYKFGLRSRGRISFSGWVFLLFGLMWMGLNAHSGFVRYHEWAGGSAFQSLQIPDELALAEPDPARWLGAADRRAIAEGRSHLGTASNLGLFANADAIPKLAWFEYLSGNSRSAVDLLAFAASVQSDRARAVSLYYRGAILNRLGRPEEALADLDAALGERPDLAGAMEERGESLWRLGRRADAESAWRQALAANQQLPLACNFLAQSARLLDKPDDAARYQQQADASTPADPLFHVMLGLRLKNLAMSGPANDHFDRAARLDPRFRDALR